MTRMLILAPETGLSTLIQEILELEGYEVVEAANSYEGLQTADAAPLAGVILDVRYLVIV